MVKSLNSVFFWLGKYEGQLWLAQGWAWHETISLKDIVPGTWVRKLKISELSQTFLSQSQESKGFVSHGTTWGQPEFLRVSSWDCLRLLFREKSSSFGNFWIKYKNKKRRTYWILREYLQSYTGPQSFSLIIIFWLSEKFVIFEMSSLECSSCIPYDCNHDCCEDVLDLIFWWAIYWIICTQQIFFVKIFDFSFLYFKASQENQSQSKSQVPGLPSSGIWSRDTNFKESQSHCSCLD